MAGTSWFPHGGNLAALAERAGKSVSEILDFSANINPLGMPAWVPGMVAELVPALVHYPDPEARRLVRAAATRYGCAPESVITGNGSAEIMTWLPRTLGCRRAVIPVPSYADYERAAVSAACEIVRWELREDDGFTVPVESLSAILRHGDLVFLGHPNNPTGRACVTSDLRRLALAHPRTWFVVDEAFGDFVADFESLVQDRPANVIVLLSLTKMFAMPGLRVGCAVAEPEVVAAFRAVQPYWSVSTLADFVGAAALADLEFIRKSRELVGRERAALAAQLQEIPGLQVYPGEANFLLVRLTGVMSSGRLAERMLLEHGIAVRDCANFSGLDERFVRVAVRCGAENRRLVQALGECHQFFEM